MTDEETPLVDRVRSALAGETSRREVRMFGSLAFMIHEKMVVAANQDGLLVRVDPSRHEELIGRPGARTAEMGRGRSMGEGWVHVAGDALRTGDDLAFWIQVGMDYNASVLAGPS